LIVIALFDGLRRFQIQMGYETIFFRAGKAVFCRDMPGTAAQVN
jgi:hypothetical protein